MNLKEHYNELYENSKKVILDENYIIDNQIKDAKDFRFGLTLLVRPNDEIKANVQSFLNELKHADSRQYYYPNSDIHITVMSIISCYDGFVLDKIKIEDYIEIIKKSLIGLDKIKICFKGVTASPSAVMIQGFPADETLNILRDQLRKNFKKSDLEQSIDSRYTISTAHLTVLRFQEKLENTKQLIEIAEKYREFTFGEFTVNKLELVYNDWYQREENTIHLKNFNV